MVLSVPLPEFADVRAGQARTIASLLTRMPGGGWLSAAEADGLLRCYGLHARFAGRMSGVLVEPMITSGIETLAGVVQEPVFGPVVVFGLGGIATGVLADHAAPPRAAHRRRGPHPRHPRRAVAAAARGRHRCAARHLCSASPGSPTTCPRSPSLTSTR